MGDNFSNDNFSNDPIANPIEDPIEDPNDFGLVFRAVAAGKSAQEVSHRLGLCAQGSSERRAAAASACAAAAGNAFAHRFGPDLPAIEVAYLYDRGDLVALLLESGADTSKIWEGQGCEPVALCIHFDLPRTLDALLASGRIDANAPARLYNTPEWVGLNDSDSFESGFSSTAVHLCAGPTNGPPLVDLPRLECLRVLLERHGADANAKTASATPPSSSSPRATPARRPRPRSRCSRKGPTWTPRDNSGARLSHGRPTTRTSTSRACCWSAAAPRWTFLTTTGARR